MRTDSFTYKDAAGDRVFTYVWMPDDPADIRGLVQIAHGMAETAGRYARFAEALTAAGCAVYANDHRGHGQTAESLEHLGIIGENGFRRMTDAMAELTRLMRERHPGLPLLLFGHSMGSFLAQQYMYLYPERVDGVVLSGSNGPQGPLLWVGIGLARLLIAFKGPDFRSSLLKDLTLGSYNRRFRPVRTEFDWLSRDKREVDGFAEDPYCGAMFPAGFWLEFFRGLAEIAKPANLRRIPADLPVLIFSGERDPVGGMGKGVRRLYNLYRRLGLEDVTMELYEGGRHEMLNEINRDEVVEDVLRWMRSHGLCGESGTASVEPG